MKYQVNITETNHGFVEVDAENKEEAIEFATDAYLDGNTSWAKSYIDTEIINIDIKMSPEEI